MSQFILSKVSFRANRWKAQFLIMHPKAYFDHFVIELGSLICERRFR